ncbi:MAG: TonB-dependent receptor [Pseudomonadota bacterium]
MRLRFVSRIILIAVSAFLLFPVLAPAEEMTESKNDAALGKSTGNQVFVLGEIEVIGKPEESVNETVTRITDEQMRVFDRNNMAEAANLAPGVTLSKAGARNEAMVCVRGFDLKHTPIFLDGIPIYVPYDGYPDLGRFTTFDLSEVIISKGFTSVLYGPNTMGGAINMVSKRPEKKYEANGGAGFRTGDSYSAYTNIGTNQGPWYLQAGASYTEGNHYRLSRRFKEKTNENGGDRENSYFKDTKGSIKVGFTPNEFDEYALTYSDQHGEKGTPPYTGDSDSVSTRYWQWPYWDKRSVYFNSKTGLGEKSYVKLRLYYDELKNNLNSYDDNTYSTITKKYAFKSFYNDYTHGGSVEAGTSLMPWQTLKAAFHLKEDYHEEHNEGDPVQKFHDEILSGGLEDAIDFTDSLYAILGVSYDQVRTVKAQDNVDGTLTSFHKKMAYAWNPQGGLFYRVLEDGLAHASVAWKSRIPSIKDKYSYKMGKALPNPDLDPEKSINYEAGYRHDLFKRVRLEATVFYYDIRDFILSRTVADPDNPGQTLEQNQNVGKVHKYGFEVGASGSLTYWLEAGVNFSYLRYENKTNDDKLLNTPENKLFGYLKVTPIEPLGIMGQVEYNSKRYSSSDGTRKTKGYTLVGTKISYEVVKGMFVEGGVDNLFDENYEIDEGYPEEGRTFFANVRFKI